MKNYRELLNSKKLNLIIGILLAFAWGIFSYVHILGFQQTGDWSYLLFCATETLVAFFFLIRTEPNTISTDLIDWGLAICATFSPFFFTPAAWGILPEAKLMMAVGSTIQIAGLISLNRSFGLVAANREIKTAGMYRVIRHPLYASYFLSFTGYLLANSSFSNLMVYTTTMVLLFFRLLREEKHLSLDKKYRDYMKQVPYRVIPLIF